MSIDAYTQHVSGEKKEENNNDVIEGFDATKDYVAEAQKQGNLEKKDGDNVLWMDGGHGGTTPAEKGANREERLRDAA